MNADLGKTEFTPEEIDDLRDRVLHLKKSLSWADLEAAIGIPGGTLSQWTPGTYNGGGEKLYANQSIPQKVHRYFQAAAERAELEALLPVQPGFQFTPTGRRILACFAMAQTGDMVAVAAAPGVGKSAAVIQYRATRPQVWVVTCKPSTRGAPTFLVALLAALGERGAKGTPQVLSTKVVERVLDTGGLIIVDEAQHLSQQALEELRGIHDETGIGVALVGDGQLVISLSKYPQLFSRLGMKLVLKGVTPADARQIANAWGVDKGPELAELISIGTRSGALRSLSKTMRLAVHAARTANTPLSLTEIREAHQQLAA